MYATIVLAITVAAGIAGFVLARRFVRRRLRFVDAVRSPLAPLIAGAAAAVVVWPAALLPMITGTTAVIFGVGTGLGTASGVKALKRGD
ncbi:MAG TPA: hypothetical protein VFL95_05700 [Gemmatimonadales bacterium]|jgi:hypothetical protein|nr:hypothetical protein [Gemmatimonadales bacterium]